MGTKVRINHTAKKGKIEIEYYGNEDLERVLGFFNIKGEWEWILIQIHLFLLLLQ